MPLPLTGWEALAVPVATAADVATLPQAAATDPLDLSPDNPAQHAREQDMQRFWAGLVSETSRQLGGGFTANVVAYRTPADLPDGAPGDPAFDYYSKSTGACGAFQPGTQLYRRLQHCWCSCRGCRGVRCVLGAVAGVAALLVTCSEFFSKVAACFQRQHTL